MPDPQKLAEQVTQLNPTELQQFVAVVAKQLAPGDPWPAAWVPREGAGKFPSIESTPGVCGGAARLIRTRIPVWIVERMRQLGLSEADILRSYPTLRAADLAQAWSYAAEHADEIEQAIRENEEA